MDLQVNIVALSGPLPPINISAESTVHHLKLLVQSLSSNYVYHRQKLVITTDSSLSSEQIELRNERTLESYQISSSSNLVLIITPISDRLAVEIDNRLMSDAERFNALLFAQDVPTVSLKVNTFHDYDELLLKLFSENRSIHAVELTGRISQFTLRHLTDFETLVSKRPDIEIKLNFIKSPIPQNWSPEAQMIQKIVDTCKYNVSLCSFWHCFGLFAATSTFTSTLQSLVSLNSLILSCNEIGDAGCAMLSPALLSMPSLHELVLSNNNIGDVGCAALASGLQAMTSLNTLDLSSNRIGFDGIAVFAPILQCMTSIKSFDLSSNELGNTGCSALAPALQSMTVLQSLRLSSNKIGNSGCIALAFAWQSMSSLQSLRLSSNKIGNSGCSALASVLQSMSSLQSLVLSDNHIGDAGCCSLVAALQLVPALQSLDLEKNRIGAVGGAAALQALGSIESLNL
jgi:hypothetical protein